MLKLLLARVGVPLELTESCTSGVLGLVSAKALFPFNSIEHKSSVVEEEHPYGSSCSSPRLDVSVAFEREGIDEILGPVL
jgi:hypothetical protein